MAHRPDGKITLTNAEFRLNARAHSSTEALAVGNAAFGLFVLCGLASIRTDRPGFVSPYILGYYSDVRRPQQRIQRLVEAGLWKPVHDGWLMMPVKCGSGQLFTITFEREPIPEELRLAVMKRDGNICVLCGTSDDLTLDHIHPWSKGGPSTLENLRVLCRPCNSRKGAQ